MKLQHLLESSEPDLDKIAQMIFKIAEERAFDESSESRSAVSGDAVFSNAIHDILPKIETRVTKLIDKEYGEE